VTHQAGVHYLTPPADQDGVEIDRCPGCGAKVRPESSWCSLCYQDLRPASQLVTTPAPQAGDVLAAPLVEAALEPGSDQWTDAADVADAEIVDAELVGDPSDIRKIVAPRDGAHDADQAALAALDAELDEDAETSRLAALTWSCKCGEVVSFAEDGCPVCGGSFLGDLHDGTGGRHRPGAGALSWLPESRQVRLALSAFIAIAIAVFIPLLLSLFG
jgi:hypothetical protein